MKLLFERYYPYIFGLIATYLWWNSDIPFPKGDSLLSATLTVSGIFVGFLATSKAILISMSSPIIDDLKRSGYINELVSYIGQAIWGNLAYCAICVVGYFVSIAEKWYGSLWIGASIFALFSFIRVTHIMLKIFKHS